MLYTDEERSIMSSAIQPNIRAKNVRTEPFTNIITDYLKSHEVSGKAVLDIGPGQCDFLDIMKGCGAKTFGVDFDPAIIRLGEIRGHVVRQAELRAGWPFRGEVFDGIFCRGSINCFWFTPRSMLEAFVSDIIRSLAPNGWLWIAPWNKPAESQESYRNEVEDLIASWTLDAGIRREFPSEVKQIRYGIKYQIPLVEIWSKS